MTESIKPGVGKDTYTRLYYVVLRRRACHFCVITFATSAGILWLAMLDGKTALWNGLRISLWIMAGAVWASATIPMMMLRRSQRQTSPSACLTRYQAIISVLGSAQYLAAAFLLSLSALLLWACYVAAASALNEDPDLKLFKSMPGRGASQLNERPVYLAASAVFCACSYSFLVVYDQRFSPRAADQPEGAMISQRIWRSLPLVFTRANRLTFICSVTFLPIYLVCRRYIIRAIVFSKYVQLTRFIKPHLVMMIKFNSIFTFTTNIRLVVLDLLMVSCWEVTQAFWDVYLTQPLAISQFSDEPNRCLLEGLRAVDPRIQYRALAELAQISWRDPARRVSIFKDIRSQPKIFNAIVDECISVIHVTQARVASRGQIVPTGKSSTTNTITTQASHTVAGQSRSALVKDLPQLFNPQPQSNSLKKALLSKLLTSPPDSGSSAPQAPTPKAPPTHQQAGNNYQIPEIFQSPRKLQNPEKQPEPTLPPPPLKKVLAAPNPKSRKEKIVPKAWELARTSRLLRSLEQFCALEDWLFLPSVRMEVRRSLIDHRTCTLAVEAVTNLICASLTEDQYGVAQDQIPRVIECLIECLETVKTFSLEICEEYRSSSEKGSADEELKETMEEFVGPLLTRLNDGTVGVLDQFGPYLKEWTFSPKTDAWIQARVKKA
ncbi:hypothetical protein CROQUDRAFT_656286 [Cronartium quercuum f. sp. fusiforme G11]|uniref:Uncharacterized protein n=1 Tax=Cronartium quercuum f. sp. fusiforme G11 TaxID=708437 RepID=A0A9P6TD19_9BASI|nr:hypothetical protein CROQUDRAFT_656286 [Cronartium quercuum f. sp. fusiforme G11]